MRNSVRPHPSLGIDLKDIDGRKIAAGSACLNHALISECRRRGRPLQKRTVRIRKPAFLSDLKTILHEKLYERVFEGCRDRILRLAAATPVQESLFREIFRLRRMSQHTYRHFLLIGALSARMAMDLRAYGYDPRRAFLYGMAHDIGKTRIPPRLLNKKGRLTRDEHKLLRSYPANSLLLLHYYLGARHSEACRVAYEHHETLDGSGYPKGIKHLSKYTRVVAVADIFDALVAYRPYRKKQFTVRGALDKLIHGMRSGKFPKLPVRLLISYYRAGRPNFRTLKISRVSREPDPAGNSYGKFAG